MKPIRFYLIALVIVICDQVSKWSVVRALPPNGTRPVLGRFLSLTYTVNTGGAFSLFQARNIVFIFVAVIAMVALTYAYHKFQRHDLYISAALALALGGAVGNLIDRIRLGHVIDFFDVHFWPIFNVADSAITIGILLLAWHFLFGNRKQETGQRETEAEPPRTPEHLNT